MLGFGVGRWTFASAKLWRQLSSAAIRFHRPSISFIVEVVKLRLVVEHDPETKRWAAFFPELPGCASAGDTEEEAIQNAKEALELWFEPAPVNLSAGAKVLEVALT
jgi:predicted RNase H-like HicB family nuclease